MLACCSAQVGSRSFDHKWITNRERLFQVNYKKEFTWACCKLIYFDHWDLLWDDCELNKLHYVFSAEIFTTELKFCFVTRMLQTTQALVLPFRWEWTTCRYCIFVSLYHAFHVSSFFCCCFNISNNNQGFRGAFDRSGSYVLFLLWEVGDEVISPF